MSETTAPDTGKTAVVGMGYGGRPLAGAGFSVTGPDTHEPTIAARRVGTERLRDKHGLMAVETPAPGTYDAMIVAGGHRVFVTMGAEALRKLGKAGALVYDIKGIFGTTGSDLRL